MGKLTDEQKIQCVLLYNQGQSCEQLSKKFKVYPQAINSILKRRGVKIRRHIPQIHHFNDTVFDIIDTEEKSYWLGFILGDGYVNNTSLAVELSQKDLNHLYKLKKFLKSDREIKITRKNCCKISFNSKYLVQSLNKHGIVKSKTYKDIRTPQSIPNNLLCHFYRGILDADGWITKSHKIGYRNNYYIGFSSYNKPFLLEIQNWISINLNKKVGTLLERQRKNQRVCQLVFGGSNLYKDIYLLLYNNTNIYLNRKYNLSKLFYNEIINAPPNPSWFKKKDII